MAEKGLVIEQKDNNKILIKLKRKEACAKCRACIAGLSEKEMFIEADNLCNASVNDWVEIELTENGFIFAVGIMYGIPLVAFFAGVLVGNFILPQFLTFANADFLSFVTGIIFVGLSYLWIRSQEGRWEKKKITPMATRITTQPLPEEE